MKLANQEKYLTQDQLRKVFSKFQYNDSVNFHELIISIEEELADHSVDKITSEEMQQIKKIIINDEEILDQLRTARKNRESGTSQFVDTEEDFDRLFEEVSREQNI
jgi:hypothetical protein